MTKRNLWLIAQVLVSALVIIWLSIDFYNSLFHGVTRPLRITGGILFGENPVVFIFVMSIKLAVYGFFIHLIKDCYKKYHAHKQKQHS